MISLKGQGFCLVCLDLTEFGSSFQVRFLSETLCQVYLCLAFSAELWNALIRNFGRTERRLLRYLKIEVLVEHEMNIS